MEKEELFDSFHVPLNEEGVKEMMHSDYSDNLDNPSQNIWKFILKVKYNYKLYSLYKSFNKTFGILIEDNKDEDMKKEDVPAALEMALEFKKKVVDDDTLTAIDLLIKVLTFANDHGSMVRFWFREEKFNKWTRDEAWVSFHVPVNKKGAAEMEYLDYIDNPSPNIKEFYLKFKYNDKLNSLYTDFNHAFDIIIDDCENEDMRKEDVPAALNMALQFKKDAKNENTIIAIDKLIEVLAFAKEHESMVRFWF